MRRIRALPIQLRITLGSLLVAAIVLAGVAALLAYQIRATTSASEETLARSDIEPYLSDLQKNPAEKPDDPATGVLIAVRSEKSGFLIDSLPRELQENLDDRDLHDPEFELQAPSGGRGGGRSGEAPTRRVTSDGTTYVVVEQHLTTSEGQFTLWAARSTTSGDLTIAALDRSLLIGLLVALVAFGGAAWLLSSLSLRPVRQLVRSAESLSRSDSGQALPVSSAGDELSTLATTLNAFIARLRASADHERQMVSDASHELRTPLAALTARLELAHRSFGDAEALEREIVAAERSVARLTDLTTTLLELSRLEQPGEPEGAGLRTTAEILVAETLDAVDRARVAPGHGGVEVQFDVDGVTDTGHEYAVAPVAFGRIADNLIGNAVTFSPEDGVVRVVLAQEGGLIRLSVSDDGPGVPEEFLPVAFDRFTRADESRRRIRGGSGLGLTLVRGLAERAGGRASLVNGADGGAVAVVELPQM
ncbi:HAMP domain-containing sensor histidine kinase [Frondihabitans peucedani]|uniref:histidine kinase n=1 Tax=Frondihabitans peucedani TaxID=598626 RepID=A0ABP8DXV6_9MICO